MNHAGNQSTRQQGFTLIELMLAMTFVSVLLIAIALTIIQIGTIYNKGIVLKEMNQVGRALGDDVRRTTAAAENLTLDTDYILHSAGGRLCLGTYSYLWNTKKAVEQGDVNITTYSTADEKPLHLVKVPDSAKIYCAKNPSGALVHTAITAVDTLNAKELLPSGDHSFGVNQFRLLPNTIVEDATTGESIYTLEYTLGSGKVSAMNSDQSACLGPNELESDLTYCTVVQFSLVLRTGNKVN